MRALDPPLLPVPVDRGSGPPLVLLHGLGMTHDSWSYVLDKLDVTRNRVVALDLLGFGDAPKPDVGYTLDDHADAVLRTLDAMGVEPAVVAGHSMGCLVAGRIAVRRPGLADRLLLLGSPVFRTTQVPRKAWKVWQRESPYLKVFQFISEQPDITLDAAQAVDTFAPLVKGMEITAETWEPFKRSLRHSIMTTDGYDDLQSLTVPTDLVHGRLDFFVIGRTLRDLAAANPHLTYRTMWGPHEISPFEGRTIAKILQPRR